MPTNAEIEQCINDWCHNVRHRQALKGRMMHGLTNGEIASEMHVDERTVKRYVQKGKKAVEGHI